MDLGLAYPEAVADSVWERLRIDLIAAERDALLVVRQSGTYPSAMLDRALTQLDAEQIGIELRR